MLGRVSLVLFALLALAAPAHALPGAGIPAAKVVPRASYPGMQTLRYKFGPIKIQPGQNNIEFAVNKLKPQVPGYITRFAPSLVYAKTGRVPRVDVIHLHHGVWIIGNQPTFAAGEEKTQHIFPQGYGFRHDPSTPWVMNHMIHNLTPTPTSVYITYTIDFVPDTAPAAAGVVPIKPQWLDVAGISAYPVFDAIRGQGNAGRYTFPEDASGLQVPKIGSAQQWRAPEDLTIVATAGHLHPGGLYNDLFATRGTATKRLFRSVAKYFEPAGAVSWDVSMTATKPDWRVAVRQGDNLSTSVTYDTARASWYESMGIMVLWYADGIQPDAKDPFSTNVFSRGRLTHGHLRENDNHGGGPVGLPNPAKVRSGKVATDVAIRNFVYRPGDLSLTGRAGRLPVVRPGQTLRFTNYDSVAGQGRSTAIYHTITACRLPCNRQAGIAYPLADARPGRLFDSGELGFGPNGFTPAAQRNTWKTPRDLPPGTYSYFCRVHPFMRGGFRVKGST